MYENKSVFFILPKINIDFAVCQLQYYFIYCVSILYTAPYHPNDNGNNYDNTSETFACKRYLDKCLKNIYILYIYIVCKVQVLVIHLILQVFLDIELYDPL